MIVNPGKFQAIILDKKKNDHTREIIKIGKNDEKVKSSIKLLGVQIDPELNINLHIANICRSAANQLNALIRLKNFLGFQEKKVLINNYFYSNFNYCPLIANVCRSAANQLNALIRLKNFLGFQEKKVLINNYFYSNFNYCPLIANVCRSAANQLNALIRLKNFLGFQEKKVLTNNYFYSNFNYCPLVWMFSHAKSLKKVEALHKRALRFLYDDYNSPSEEILKKLGKFCMELNRLRNLCI